ncbi:MAG: hypothetical protein AB9828_06605 [Sphaerochaetaceae bacterium]
MTVEQLMSIEADRLPVAAESLESHELPFLVDLLSETDDKVRYQVFQLLQERSSKHADVYPFWDVFATKLSATNSYQRSIGLIMIACNAQWDQLDRMDSTIDAYLGLLEDEKPITVRQCIQALEKIVACKPALNPKIATRLISLDLSKVRNTMRKLVLVDILRILAMIHSTWTNDALESYIFDAFSGGLLDPKSKKQIEALL